MSALDVRDQPVAADGSDPLAEAPATSSAETGPANHPHPQRQFLRDYIAAWDALPSLSPWARSLVSEGYRLEFMHEPCSGPDRSNRPVYRGPIDASNSPPQSPATPPQTYVVTPTKQDDVKLLLPTLPDGSPNLSQLRAHLKMETPTGTGQTSTLRKLLQKNDYVIDIALDQPYSKLLIAPEHQPYLSFRGRECIYRIQTLPRQFSPTPVVLARLLVEALKPLREQKMRILHIEWHLVVAHEDPEVLEEHKARIVEHLESLGFPVVKEASIGRPARTLDLFNVHYDTQSMELRLAQSDVVRLLQPITLALCKMSLSVGILERAAKCIYSIWQFIGFSGLSIRQTQWLLANVLRRAPDYSQRAVLTQEAFEELQNWSCFMDGRKAIPMDWRCDRRVRVRTDASALGWSVVAAGFRARGRWTPAQLGLPINVRELWAIEFAVGFMAERYPNHRLEVETDSQVARDLANGTAYTDDRWEAESVARIKEMVSRHGIELRAIYLPGCWNGEADRNSRVVSRIFQLSEINQDVRGVASNGSPPCYSPSNSASATGAGFPHADTVESLRRIFQEIKTKLPPMSIDAMARKDTAVLPRYWCQTREPPAKAVDAFKTPWTDQDLLIRPKQTQIPRVLYMLRSQKASAVVVTPFFREAEYWKTLLQLTVHTPMVFIGRGKRIPSVAWPLSGDIARRRKYLDRLKEAPEAAEKQFPWFDMLGQVDKKAVRARIHRSLFDRGS